MNLYLTTNSEPVDGLHLDVRLLNVSGVDDFILSQKWDELFLELVDDIHILKLWRIKEAFEIIHIKLPNTVTMKTVRLLSELYPDLKGTLRKSLKERVDIDGLLPNLWRPGSSA